MKQSKGREKKIALRFLQVAYEYPRGLCGTSEPTEYAYFINDETGQVIKRPVDKYNSIGIRDHS